MVLWVCQNGHDHEKDPVAVSKEGGRKIHCPDIVKTTKKYRPELWTEMPISAAPKDMPACSFCFASPGAAKPTCDADV